MSNSEMQFQNASDDTSAEIRHNAVPEMDAREQMVAARTEQQRLCLLRSLHNARR